MFVSWGTCCCHRCVYRFGEKHPKITKQISFIEMNFIELEMCMIICPAAKAKYTFILSTMCCSGSRWVNQLFTTIFVNSFNSCDTHPNVQLTKASLKKPIKTFWYTPRWALYLTCISSTFVLLCLLQMQNSFDDLHTG